VTSEQVAAAILAQAAAVLGTSTGVVARLSDDGGEFLCLHASGYAEEVVKTLSRFPADARMPLSDAVRERTPVLLANLAERDARYPDLARLTGVRAEGALVALPLVVRGKAIGGIGLRFPAQRAFTEQDRAFLLTVAGLCAQALERARLYDTERAARERAEHAENALRASEERLRAIIDNWPSVIFVKDPEGRYLLANKACEAYAGESVERIIGKTDHDYMPAEVADRFRADDLRVLQSGEAVRYEEVAPRGGEERTSLTVKFPLRDASGKPYGVCGIATDITDWKRAGESLRVSEERFARFMQHLPGLAWIKDAQGKYVYANEAAVNAFDKPRAELYGKTDEEVFPPATAAQFRENDQQALAGGTGMRVVETLEHPDGVLHHSLVSKFPIPGPDGAAALVGGMAIDITEEMRTRAVLGESEERFRATFEQAAVGIAHVGPDGRWLRVNRKLCDIVGYGPEEMLARTFQDITHPDDLEADLAQVRRLLAGEIETYSMEKRYFRKDRSLVWINLTVSLVRTPEGQPKYFISVVEDITEQKGIRDALRESETKYRNLFQNMAEEVHFWQVVRDEAGRILTWRLVDANPPALKTWGKALDQIRGKTTDEIFGPGSTDHYLAVVQKIMAEGVPHAFEDYFPNLDKHFRSTSVPLGDFFITTGADITAVKKAHAALREGEERLRTLSNNLPHGAIYQVVGDSQGSRRFLYISAGVERLFGVTPEEAMADATALYGLIHEEDRRRLAAAEEAALRDLALFDCEFRSWTRGGDLRWLHCRSAPRPLPSGDFVWEGVMLDVTARKNAEAELARLAAESEKRRRLYEAALSNTPDLVYVFDLDHRFVYANEGLLRMWGKTWEEAIGKNCLELGYEPWHAAMHDREIEQVIATRQPVKGEVPFTGTFGRRIYEYIFVPVVGENGEVEAVAGTTRDVTERNVLEGRLRDQAEQLREADRRKDDFLATLAHELRNPLAPLRNGLQVMKLAAGNTGAVEQARGMMERQMAVMVRLIDDLLDVSRITRGKLELRKERVELASAVQSAVEGSRPFIEASGHRLTVLLPPEPIPLDADPTRLAQVFSNLLTNAAKYTDAGGQIRLTASRDCHGEVAVSVQDTGIGIAADHLPRLFEMFSQVKTALERSQGGLGIGLSLVKGLVEMHGGTVQARSDGVGKGSEFIVRLPVAEEMPTPESPESGSGNEAAARPGNRVLVADDNRDAADSLGLMLRLGGHIVHAVHDGQEAVDAAGWFRPDLALLDIGMPKLNGFEAARHIREQPWGKTMVLVAVTGWGQEEDRRRATEAGFDLHLTKPVDPDALEKLLAGLAAGRA
jgi:PAS domain S-box-containing protein